MPIRGDVTVDDLGMSKEDRSLIMEKVSIVFHCAANVRFDQKLKNAVKFNTMGTRRVLELAENIANLDVSHDFFKFPNCNNSYTAWAARQVT